MALIINPVSFTGKKLSPFATTSATSLFEYLPQGSPANCLLLGGCDPRKILYSFYMEQDNGMLSD